MHISMYWASGALLAAAVAGSAAAQVAVTEFLNNPDGTDAGREWAELYNAGGQPVDLSGWTLSDEGADAFTLPAVMLQPGEHLVLVAGGVVGGVDGATAKAIFEAEWLGGAVSPAVIGMDSFSLSNGADELVLRDAAGEVVWSLAWSDDETETFSTFHTHDAAWSISAFGSAAAPGVVRHGDDNDLPGFAGYEQNDLVADPFAWPSDIAALPPFGRQYANVELPSLGSPLTGGYLRLGDLDGDGSVGVPDLVALLSAWGPCGGPCAPPCDGDLDGDCLVGVGDLIELIAAWG